MRILITGSRGWGNPRTVWEELYSLGIQVYNDPDDQTLVLVHGDCPTGVDRLVRDWVQQGAWRFEPVQLTQEPHPADWGLGRHGGFLRNQYMVDLGADLCLAFIRDGSRGATHCAMAAEKAGIETRIFREEGDA